MIITYIYRMQQSKSRFSKGVFHNISPTPQLAEGYSMIKLLKDFFTRPKTVEPSSVLPSVRTDLKNYYSKEPSIIWFGHSSYLIHCDGTNILIDPVLSGAASPFSFYIKAFKGADDYKGKDMPPIDILIITHNHYDHLDKKTIGELAKSTKKVITSLKVGKDLLKSGVQKEQVTELNWWQSINIDGIELTATPARHFSGRGLKRNQSLWSSFVLAINGYKIFIGSDSGYDVHFKEIGYQFGPFDIALLECGQYNEAWPYIHSMPEDLVKEGKELNAKVLMPVHWAKFALALHPWNEPIERFIKAIEKSGIEYTTPLIGQPVVLGKFYPKEKWWR